MIASALGASGTTRPVMGASTAAVDVVADDEVHGNTETAANAFRGTIPF